MNPSSRAGLLAVLAAVIDMVPAPARRAAFAPDGSPRGPVTPVVPRVGPRVGRNEPCPCGSGKKWKKCCMDKARGCQGGGEVA